jgi:polyferredoxin
VGSEGMIVAASKNKATNWLILGLSFLVVSMVLGLLVLMIFYTRSYMWAFITSGSSPQPGMLVMFVLTSFLIFIDIATVRYLYCDYPCLYRVGLRLFRSPDALHVAYDASRSSDCAKCNYCATSCITDIQPIDIKLTDTCVDCGECIDACDRLHAKSGTKGLLSFKVGENKSRMSWRKMLGKSFSRSKWLVSVFFVLGCALMVWGVATQKIVDQKKLLLAEQKIQRIAHVCNSQCARLQATCNGKNLAGCYRASACKCACSLEQDPSGPLADSLRECVRNSTAHVRELGLSMSSPADQSPIPAAGR